MKHYIHCLFTYTWCTSGVGLSLFYQRFSWSLNWLDISDHMIRLFTPVDMQLPKYTKECCWLNRCALITHAYSLYIFAWSLFCKPLWTVYPPVSALDFYLLVGVKFPNGCLSDPLILLYFYNFGCIGLQYRERVIYIGQHIDEEFSNQLLATMLYLDSIESSKRMFFYINSPGGDVSSLSSIRLFMITFFYLVKVLFLFWYFSARNLLVLQLTPSLAIYDTMQSLKSPVGTNCLGFAYNLATFLLAAGEKVISFFRIYPLCCELNIARIPEFMQHAAKGL